MNRRHLLSLIGGALAASPLAARAQQKAVPVIGWLGIASPDQYARYVAGFRQGLGDTGYVESAQACGLHLVAPDERDLLRADTRGVGEQVRAAVEAGARTVVVGLGGSGTNDGGRGLWEESVHTSRCLPVLEQVAKA